MCEIHQVSAPALCARPLLSLGRARRKGQARISGLDVVVVVAAEGVQSSEGKGKRKRKEKCGEERRGEEKRKGKRIGEEGEAGREARRKACVCVCVWKVRVVCSGPMQLAPLLPGLVATAIAPNQRLSGVAQLLARFQLACRQKAAA